LPRSGRREVLFEGVEVFARAGRITVEHGTKLYVTNLLSKQFPDVGSAWNKRKETTMTVSLARRSFFLGA